MIQNKISEENINRSRKTTEKAFDIAKRSINLNRKKEAEEIIKMVDAYLSDSKHFEKKGDLINAFGAIYYAHGWIDTGARLKIFEVNDDKLFTLP